MNKLFVDIINEYGNTIGNKPIKLLGITSVHHEVIAVVVDESGSVEAVNIKRLKEVNDGQHKRVDATASATGGSNHAELGSSSREDEGSAPTVRSEESGGDTSPRSARTSRAGSRKST